MITISPYPFFVIKIGSSDSWHICEIMLVFLNRELKYFLAYYPAPICGLIVPL